MNQAQKDEPMLDKAQCTVIERTKQTRIKPSTERGGNIFRKKIRKMRQAASLPQFVVCVFATLVMLILLIVYALKGFLTTSDILFLIFLVGGFSYTTVEIGLSLCWKEKWKGEESSPLLGEVPPSYAVDIPIGSQDSHTQSLP